MTRLILFPDASTQLVFDVDLPAAELIARINRSDWQPECSAATRLHDTGSLFAVRLGVDTVLAFLPHQGETPGPDHSRKPVLSQRQLAILKGMAEGLTVKQISKQLGLSTRTVFFHIAGLRERLHSLTNPAAVSRAIELGLIRPRKSGHRE